MQPLILHIPHSSTVIPSYEGFFSCKLDEEILKLTDWHTEDLYHSHTNISVIAPFSRIFCDVERFSEDEKEVMSKFGMGVLYNKYDDGRDLRVVSADLREKILKDYYWPHHKRLAEEVSRQLKEFNKSIIIDCHSFPNIPLNSSLDTRLDRPDFNIGTDQFHTPPNYVKKAQKYFNDLGYNLGIDWPYSGSMVPTAYHKINKNVRSIMLEVNRKLYLKDGSNIKSDNYKQTKEVVQGFLRLIENIES